MMRVYPGYPGVGLGHAGLFGGLFGGLLSLLMIAAIVTLIVLLVRRTHGHGHPVHMQVGLDPYADALALAARRLAAGEITPTQYEEIRETLYGPAPQRPAPGPAGPTVPMPPVSE